MPTLGEVGGVVEKGGGDLAARSGDVRLADQALGAIGIGDDLDSGHRARFLVRRPARRRPMSLARGSAASTSWSRMPRARSTWVTLLKLTLGLPDSILRRVSRVMPARSETCCAVRPESHSFGLVGVSGWGLRWNDGVGWLLWGTKGSARSGG